MSPTPVSHEHFGWPLLDHQLGVPGTLIRNEGEGKCHVRGAEVSPPPISVDEYQLTPSEWDCTPSSKSREVMPMCWMTPPVWGRCRKHHRNTTPGVPSQTWMKHPGVPLEGMPSENATLTQEWNWHSPLNIHICATPGNPPNSKHVIVSFLDFVDQN